MQEYKYDDDKDKDEIDINYFDGSKPKNNSTGECVYSVFPKNTFLEDTSTSFKLIFMLVGFFGLKIFATIISLVLSKSNDASYWTNFLAYLFIAIIFCAVLFTHKNHQGIKFLKEFKDYKIYIFAAIGFGLMYLVNIIFSLAYSKIPDYGENINQNSVQSFFSNTQVWKNFLTFFEIVIFAPFVEELTYRVGICGLISGRTNSTQRRVLGLIITSIIFGFIHFNGFTIQMYKSMASLLDDEEQLKTIAEGLSLTYSGKEALINSLDILLRNEWLNLPVYIISGIILNASFLLSGKLASSFMLHMTNNFVSYIQMLVGVLTPTSMAVFTMLI